MIPSPRALRRLVGPLAILLLAAPAFAQESWDVVLVQGKRVGSVHVRVEPLKDKGRDFVRVRVSWDLVFKRGDNIAKLTQEWGTIETPTGEILRLEVQTNTGQTILKTAGDVKNGVLGLRIEANGQVQRQDVKWSDDVRGPYGAELSLSRQKMKPGESRDVKTFLPDLNKVCISTLKAVDLEEIELGRRGDKRKLLRVEQTVAEVEGGVRKEHPEMTSTLWVDDSGQILKSHSSMLGGTDFFRTTKEGAAAGTFADPFDLLAASIVPTARIASPEKSRSLTYRVTLEDEDAATVFPVDARQQVKIGKSKSDATVSVQSLGPVDGAAMPAPGPEFSRPNPLINSDDARVMSHARKAVGRETDPWNKAVAIETWVAKNLKEKNFGVAFNNAADVARNLSGDCSEHSVLVAAMCRAEGIPTRCVVGLVYVEDKGGFGPHMWNEVYVNNRWVAIDAAFHQTRVDATHIKFSDTSLDGVSPFETFVPVLTVFKKMKIEPFQQGR